MRDWMARARLGDEKATEFSNPFPFPKSESVHSVLSPLGCVLRNRFPGLGKKTHTHKCIGLVALAEKGKKKVTLRNGVGNRLSHFLWRGGRGVE